MHDDGFQPRSEGHISDPLRHAPPPGQWVLWHGPLARAVLELARTRGTPAPPGAELPPLPPGFPPPAGESLGTFVLQQQGRRYLIQAESCHQYVSCYLLHLPE
ncbi:MAG: hypothetical protein RMK29_03270 [Myxococcales bacterium]|nr:hypothetical protein [Myxococcota bacterium]MDW8280705.1 hypothetical protein [Myxococcales bacterium]